MPVFYFLVFLGIIAFWFLLAFSYKGVGRFFKRIFNDSYRAMTSEDPEDVDITNEHGGGK